jgi:hypothetical protein
MTAFFPTVERPSARSLDMQRTLLIQEYGMAPSLTTLIK